MKNTLKSFLLGATFAAATQLSAFAQIATYNTANTVVTSNDPNNPFAIQVIPPTSGPDGGSTTVSDLTLGSGVVGTNLIAFNFGYSFTTGGQSTLAAAESHNAYFGFTLTPDANTELTVTDLDFSGAQFFSQVGAKDAATRTLYLESSVNGFATQTTLGSISVPANAFTTGIDLPLGNAFSDLTTPTEFRLYVVDPDTNIYESVTMKGTDALSIDGFSVSVPEPGTYALLGLGLAFLFMTVRNCRSLRA